MFNYRDALDIYFTSWGVDHPAGYSMEVDFPNFQPMLSRKDDSDETPARSIVRVTQSLVTEYGHGVREVDLTRALLQARQQRMRKTKM